MKKKVNIPKPHTKEINKDDNENFPDYQIYPSSEDIYNTDKEESDIDPENISKMKDVIEIDKIGTANEKDFDDDMTGEDLDIPGSELDNLQESIGSEDEENNYYSTGGDNHIDLEEDNG
ncbi:hypothetical protein ACFX5E_04055 [Flavobacterium sp. LS2P90]|uniref:Uncharacterized protein n=1 Tax=Flavobacterium xylosi TaxID=3230415 RepID=A0ABW6HTC5_9FLAO